VPDAPKLASGDLVTPVRSFATEMAPLSTLAAAHPEATKCGFAGAASHFRRQELFDLMAAHPHLFEYANSDEGGPGITTAEQAKRWMCIIDIRGRSWSARLPTVMFTGRPMLYVARSRIISDECDGELACTQLNGTGVAVSDERLIDWAEDPRHMATTIKPWEHFVPVREDLSDLVDRVRWLQANPAKGRAIARSALQFAKSHLTFDKASAHLVKQLADSDGSAFCGVDC